MAKVSEGRDEHWCGIRKETWEEMQRNAVIAVSALDAHQQLRLANLFKTARDWFKELRGWEE